MSKTKKSLCRQDSFPTEPQIRRREFLHLGGACVGGLVAQTFGLFRPMAQEANLSDVAKLAVGFQFDDSKGPVTIPALVYRNLMIIEGTIMGSKPLRFILDSGAAGSIIDTERAREIGLKPTDRTAISGVTGTAEGGRVGGAVVRLPGVDLLNHRFVMIPLTELSAHLGKRIDGLLGEDLFSKLSVTLDYSNKRVILTAPWDFPTSIAGESIPIEIRRTPFVRLRMGAGTGRDAMGTFQIDTGFNGSIHVYRSFAELHKLLEGVPKLVSDLAVGATGSMSISRGRIGTIALGSQAIPSVIASFYPPSYSSTGIGGHDGNLGGELLRRFKVTLDYTRRRMVLEPTAGMKEKDEADMSGLSLISEGPDLREIRIFSVAPNSPASKAKIKAGDQLTQLDGSSVGDLDLDRITRRLKQDSTYCDLTLKREGRSRGVRLRLSRVI